MQGNLARGLRGRIEETVQDGPRVMVAFRPEASWQGGEPVVRGFAYMVVTVRDGKIVEMKRCADRAAVRSYMRTGVAPHPETLDTVRPPDVVATPSEQRVSRLVPFVRVGDVERSVAFYEQLGFIAKSVFAPRGRLVWAALVRQARPSQSSPNPARSPRPLAATRSHMRPTLLRLRAPGMPAPRRIRPSRRAASLPKQGSPRARVQDAVTLPRVPAKARACWRCGGPHRQTRPELRNTGPREQRRDARLPLAQLLSRVFRIPSWPSLTDLVQAAFRAVFKAPAGENLGVWERLSESSRRSGGCGLGGRHGR